MMSGQQINLQNSLKPFFGDSEASAQFFASNYFTTEYDSACNNQVHPESINNTPAEFTMLAKYYNDSVRVSGQGDNDIHQEYTNFIVRTALFHRELDRTTSTGSEMVELQNAVKDAYTDLMGEKLSKIVKTGFFNPRTITVMSGAIKVIGIDDLGLNNDNNFFQLMIAEILLEKINNRVTLKSPPAPSAFEYVYSSGYSNYIIKHGDNQVKKMLDILLNKNKPPGGIWNDNLYNVAVENAFQICFNNIKEYVDYELNNDTVEKLITKVTTTDVNPLKIIFSQLLNTMENKKNYFVDCVSENTFVNMKNEINRETHPTFHNNANNYHVKNVINKVFNDWDNLDGRARTFYSKHMHLFAKTGRKSVSALPGVVDPSYYDLMPDGTYRGFGTHHVSELRINLMKDRGLTRILFEETLPWLPKECSKVWYTDKSKIIRSFEAKSDSIRDLYKQLYENGEYHVKNPSGVPVSPALKLPSDFEEVKRNYSNTKFNIRPDYIMYHKIQPVNSLLESGDRHKASFNFDLDEKLEDLTTRIIYSKDEKGLYTLKNGVKEHFNNISGENCGQSYLNKDGDNLQCQIFVSQHLLSGNKEKLANCLHELRDSDMFKYAHDELKNMNPYVAVQILKTFGVTSSIKNNIEVAENIDKWLGRVQNAEGGKNTWTRETREAILSNKQLQLYLRGVIDFVNSHPTILNPKITSDEVQSHEYDDEVHPEDRLMKKQRLVNPFASKKTKKWFESQGQILGAFASNMRALPPMFPNFNPYTNVIPGQPYGMMGMMGMPQMGMLQMGGNYPMSSSVREIEEKLNRRYNGNETDTELLYALMESTMKELEVLKTPLKEGDREEIRKAFDKMNKNRQTMIDLHIMLRHLVDLLNFFKTSCCDNLEETEINISGLRSERGTIEQLKKSIGNLEGCITRNTDAQTSSCNTMLEHLSKILINASQ